MKKFRFRLQVVLDMREKELEQRQMEMAKIVAALNSQQAKLQEIFEAQDLNTRELEALYNSGELDIVQIEGHKAFGIRLVGDARNQQRIIDNTKSILKRKQEAAAAMLPVSPFNDQWNHRHKASPSPPAHTLLPVPEWVLHSRCKIPVRFRPSFSPGNSRLQR